MAFSFLIWKKAFQVKHVLCYLNAETALCPAVFFVKMLQMALGLLCLGLMYARLYRQLLGLSPHWRKSQFVVHCFNINVARIRTLLKYPPWSHLWLGHLGNSSHFEWCRFIGRTSEVAGCLILTYWFHFARHTGSKSSLAELHNLQQTG